jgi:hypothetical protein
MALLRMIPLSLMVRRAKARRLHNGYRIGRAGMGRSGAAPVQLQVRVLETD